MKGPCHQLFAGTGLPHDKSRGAYGGHFLDSLIQLCHLLGGANETCSGVNGIIDMTFLGSFSPDRHLLLGYYEAKGADVDLGSGINKQFVGPLAVHKSPVGTLVHEEIFSTLPEKVCVMSAHGGVGKNYGVSAVPSNTDF